ncbi:hypothetical protein RO3G_17205 [Rhizopus delemar RA 99-880]|uniref:Uncharacterized protein n=1 Tax=Rhizopus delemar (strain RA 99-880 / ATCC MYA-4621 / FGSC 9543 / NRRL 43880) TaxID=246409 RepID=I1CV54_RHIO9|nr:hypothetical protein RO3G_17205 [Rhizopus delemar RA 99-880]|eukprot:EIE92334.1 hypothetical protein RO3G_17205 [Rhizopus delemar RA 99-880]
MGVKLTMDRYDSFDKSQFYLQLVKNPNQKLNLTIKYLAVINV